MTSTPFHIRELTSPEDVQLRQIADILYEGFKDVDPISSFACGDDPALMREFHHATMAGAVIGGHVFVAETISSPKKIIGCVAFFGPGSDVLGDEEQLSQGFNNFLSKLSPDVVDWWMGFMPKFAAMSDAILGPGVKESGWKMNCLAVSREFRRKGVGTALVNAGEDLARKDKNALIFEGGSEGTELYCRMEYDLVGSQSIGGDADPKFKSPMEKLTLNIFRKDFRC
ncbi:hypothetical protein PUNSTDRAFT_137779 [Punctularia strigosozonata HHB-11173 SS5]|uniref:N-acetyltransferase domain-containing protein n=1 Tax=Punctularia strigosozonata (strain HHB-11173) TaxID=741275 RepID=R7S4D7_PUNST|nr:uncharacterized protein PUNSTDRAFT_137779 [Punctularia strigosozonata HHB-11173 SS5]EIN05093.1 hypothetical protein PUNSTDRAFT_137779 [Punctularia strigosozonata HHB-11173 SS5]